MHLRRQPHRVLPGLRQCGEQPPGDLAGMALRIGAADQSGEFVATQARHAIACTHVLAQALGQKLVFDPAIERAITERFAKFNRVPTANNLKQAFRFERGDVLPNANGTAPGLWVEQDGRILIMLPGPPNELQPMFTEQVPDIDGFPDAEFAWHKNPPNIQPTLHFSWRPSSA